MNNLSTHSHRGGSRAPSHLTSARQERESSPCVPFLFIDTYISSVGKWGLNVDGFFLGTPSSAAVPLPPKNSSPYKLSPDGSEFTDAKACHSANKALTTAPYYDMFANGGLPPIFTLLLNCLSTNYPGVRRVILEVDDMPQASSDESSSTSS